MVGAMTTATPTTANPEPRGAMTTTTPPVEPSVGPVVRAAREALGLSIDELARLAGTNPDWVRRIEGGEHTPSPTFRDHLSGVVADAMVSREVAAQGPGVSGRPVLPS